MRNELALLPGMTLALALPFLALSATGCTGDDPVPCSGPACTFPADGDGGAAFSPFDLASAPASAIALTQGSVVEVDVTVTRAGFDGPIHATAAGLPAGVSAAPLVIAAGATTAKLTLTALATAAQGATAITLSASDAEGKVRREKPASLLVRGAAGALDTTFGGTGKLTRTVSATGLAVRSVVSQSDGRILVAGLGENDFTLTRLELDGRVDTTYGVNGKITADLRVDGMASVDLPESVALAPNGDAVLAGYRQNAESTYGIARFTSAGALDTGFDLDGYAAPIFAPQPSWNGNLGARAVVVQPDGKPVFAGTVMQKSGTNHAVIARFKTNGALDDTFGTGGSGFFHGQSSVDPDPNLSSDDTCEAIAVGADGKLVAAGTSMQGGTRMFAVRVDGTGNRDAGFGSKGFAVVPFPAAAEGHSVHALADGRVIVTGESAAKMVAVRLTASGQLDTTFGAAKTGIVSVDVGAVTTGGRSFVDSAGRIVLAGSTGDEGDIVVARLSATGVIDATFGAGGYVSAKIGAKTTKQNVRVAQAPDGRVVVVTNLDTAAPDLVAMRFWP